MGILIHIFTVFACVQTVHLYPLQGDDNVPLYGHYGRGLAKRPYIPYNEAVWAPYFLSNPSKVKGQNSLVQSSRGQNNNARKKAIDDTFIRFGRSAEALGSSGRSTHNQLDSLRMVEEPADDNARPSSVLESSPELADSFSQLFLLNHSGCRLRNGQELLKAILNDPQCIRAFQKVKKENVNDTFMGFGKREAALPERDFESENSKEAR